jgi:outer membrane immunogenic protein
MRPTYPLRRRRLPLRPASGVVGMRASTRVATGATRTPSAPSLPSSTTFGSIAEQNGLIAATTTNQSVKNNGFIGGGQFGYNQQFGTLVAGFEADIQGLSHTNGSTNLPVVASLAPFGFPLENYTGTVSVSRQLDYLGTVRGRVGFLATPSFLVYVTGGLAYGGVSTGSSFALVEHGALGPGTTLPPVIAQSGSSTTRYGSTAGVGGEWMFAPHWSAKLEYLYYDLGSVTDNALLVQSNPPTAVFHSTLVQTTTHFSGNIVRVGANYKFDFPGAPLVAKY